MPGRPEYRLYALKYAGPRTRPENVLFWLKDTPAQAQINYYIWFLQWGGEAVVVDTGAASPLAGQQRLENYTNPAHVLNRIGVKAETVTHVILTHLHWDHAGGISLFPNARFYLQADEFEFWIKDPIAQRAPFLHPRVWDNSYKGLLKEMERKGQLVLLEGDEQVVPGVECLLTPGHSPGLQSVAVSTEKGTAVLGSDCAMLFKNYEEDWPGAIICDMVAWMRSFDKLRAKVSAPDLLFPGHDPLMTQNYPTITKDVTRLV
jgi:glyoxylase-like metal-dependent hydrolase (beta-lactamase superfamily II)